MKARLELMLGDITKLTVDAIVNAANTSLLGGGGVDGAIHRAGGKTILEECIKIRNQQGGCKVGEAVVTTAGNLSATYIIHTVGPVWNGGKRQEEELLANAYRSSLAKAYELNAKTVAFPNISTGIYHFPKDRAAEIAIQTIRDFLDQNETIETVIFICHDPENHSIYNKLLNDQQ